MDAQLGKVLAALHASGLANDTVVALFGDHGWHVGENNEWAKHTAMTRAAKVPLLVALLHNILPQATPTNTNASWLVQVPLLFSTPQQRTARTATATATATAAATATATATTEHGAPAGGLASEGGSYAELVDLLPTLCDLAGVPVPPTCADDAASASAATCTEGVSLAPLVRAEGTEGAAGVPTKAAAFSQWQMNGHNAFTTWTRMSDGSPVRYTEWQNYDHSDKNGVFKAVWAVPPSFGAELYNHSADPDENHNIAATASQAVLDALRKTLHEGWRAQI